MPKDTRLGSVENCFCASCASLVCSSLHSLIWTISQFAELNIKGVLTLNNWPQNRLLEQFILFYQLGKFRGQRCSELVSVVGFHRTCVQSRVATEVMLNGKMLGILHVMLSHIQKGEVRCSFKCIGFRGLGVPTYCEKAVPPAPPLRSRSGTNSNLALGNGRTPKIPLLNARSRKDWFLHGTAMVNCTGIPSSTATLSLDEALIDHDLL